MARFVINGPQQLSGDYAPSGNKNAVLPMLAAALLTDEPVVLENVPLIDDVRTMLEQLSSLGVEVELAGREVTLCARALCSSELDPRLCGLVRTSILFAGPLLARTGRATLYPPGGDVIGRRRLDTHFSGLAALGAEVQLGALFELRAPRLTGRDILLDEASVTATENILMAACRAVGETSIFNAACEPHVQDLARLLSKMGAHITGIGTNLLRIGGVDRLTGARHRVQADHVELGSFLAAAAATGGALTVTEPIRDDDLLPLLPAFRKLGVSWSRTDNGLHLPADQELRIVEDLGAAVPKIEDGPWPSFPSDLMSIAIVLATQAQGTILFFEKMFESRLYFVDRLIAMGARIVQCDPHRVLAMGPARLRGSPLVGPDIRAGMAMLVAALCADGESVIENAEVIDRGYESIETRLRGLGAEITRLP